MPPVRRFWLGLLAVSGLSACSESTAVAPPLAFNRPEHLAFLCVDKSAVSGRSVELEVDAGVSDAGADEARTERFPRPLILPMHCCARTAPLAPSDSPYTASCRVKEDPNDPTDDVEPALHALISQSTRGEVAAVDLAAGRVIDTNQLIPGYTYIDVGGLPTAVVAPPAKPVLADGKTTFSDEEGPPFVYVASAEDMIVRAVPSCRFQSELTKCSRGLDTEIVALPSPPRDMVLGPDFALWASLPEMGLLVRIPLSEEAGRAFEREEGLTYFAIPSVGAAEPSEPVTEPETYRAACGLGYAITQEPLALTLPTAPLGTAEGQPRPTRLRYDAESGLLLVADESEPAVRAFSIEEGVPVARGMALTGGPVRDFVITPRVPARVSASDSEFPLQESWLAPGPPPLELLEDSVRYLYAIDDRDGSVFVHTFAYDDASGTMTTTPLRMPYGSRYSDRMALGGPSLALEVIDTRPLSAPVCGVDVAAYDPNPTDGRFEVVQTLPRPAELLTADVLDTARSNTQTARDEARKAYNEKKTDQNLRAYREAERAHLRALALDSISDNAQPYQLRGVFVAVSSTDGRVRIIDVHDLDLFCRARVCDLGDDLINPNSNALGVAIQRHAPRLSTSKRLSTVLSDGSRFLEHTCPENYRPAHLRRVSDGTEQTITCIPSDPWRVANDAWTIVYEGALPGFGRMPGYVEERDEGFVVRAPAGVDLCARGVMPESIHPDGGGDVLAVVSAASDDIAGCPTVDAENPALFRIVDAFSDRLVLERFEDDGIAGPTLRELKRCYPETLSFEVRVHGEFLVTGAATPNQHRVVRDDEGHCVIDTTRDERLTIRARAEEPFTNPYVSFRLANVRNHNPFSTQVQVALDYVQHSIVDVNARADALPVTLYYLPYTGDLYVVDVASQGIRRFELSPFRATTGLR